MRGPFVLLILAALGAGFVAGRAPWQPPAEAVFRASPPSAVQVQFGQDPREVFPLVPGPGEGPGQGGAPGQAPGAGTPGAGDCTVLLHRDGRFYRLQPGTPAPGGNGQGGQPGGDGEVFPLQPAPGEGGPAVPPPTPDAPVTPDLDLRV